jgi:hypothetical protein
MIAQVSHHNLKEVEGLGQQLRDMWTGGGAFQLSAWVHTPAEFWA